METTDLSALRNKLVGGNGSAWRDWLGITASIGCAIHCAAMPFIIASLPALGLRFLADESFHKWMALVCFLVAALAFVPGIRKHGNWIPIAIGGAGLTMITFAAFGLAGECCSSCESAACQCNFTSSTPELKSGVIQVVEDQCNHCASCSEDGCETMTAIAFKDEEEKNLLSTFASWITPFGGLMLVVAHLLNRRCGGLCKCC